MPSLKDMLQQTFGNYAFKPVDIKRGDVKFTVHVRTFSGPERQTYDTKLIKKTKGKTVYMYDKQKFLLVAMTLLAGEPPDTKLMFDSVEELLVFFKDASVIDEIYAVSGQLNGILGDDESEDESMGKD